MGNRTAKFVSALIGSIIAGAPLAAVSQNAPSAPSAASTANAASDCLASPKGATPQGQHWFYRLERATKRQCWYLRAEGAKATQSAQATQGAQEATADTPNAAPAAPQSVQNAHAEYIAPQTRAAASAPAPAAASTQQSPGTADANAAQPAVATRWPDAAAASPAPQQPSPATAAAPAAAPARPSATPAASPAPVTLAAAEAPADKPTGSLQMLLLVIGGALALAGLLASIIYRFAGGRVRVQAGDHRRVNWDQRDHGDSRAPWLNDAPAPAPRAQRPRPVDFDAGRPQQAQLAAFTNEIGRIAARGRPAPLAAAEPDETEIEIFDGELEIEAPAPQLAAAAPHDAAPAGHDEATPDDEDAVNIDIITAMLERLAQEGPRLPQPSLEADLADLARIQRDRSAARA
ncbi:hypothetical protein ABID58_005718 [Bradyrhizobium sp. S3.2.6]|uniref:hypothetical protein n=1 Tax=Bradyrhizobium sp. S3.2.6 TaxID=3156428 RepID=UPI003397AE9C